MYSDGEWQWIQGPTDLSDNGLPPVPNATIGQWQLFARPPSEFKRDDNAAFSQDDPIWVVIHRPWKEQGLLRFALRGLPDLISLTPALVAFGSPDPQRQLTTLHEIADASMALSMHLNRLVQVIANQSRRAQNHGAVEAGAKPMGQKDPDTSHP